MTDTDSLVYETRSDDPNFDVYSDMAAMPNTFDTSNYPRDHPLYKVQKGGYLHEGRKGWAHN